MPTLENAVIAVVTDVLGVPGFGPEDRFDSLCTDMAKAVRVVTLLNQLLGTELTMLRLFAEGTPRRLATTLAAAGVTAPPLPPAAAPGSGEDWRTFWETTYRFANSAQRDRFNTAGWIDSRTLKSLPDKEMHEWVRATVSRVRAFAPRSVLDIGCGVGLILFPLASACDRYVGVDFAAEAIHRVRQVVATDPGLRHVTLYQADALTAAELTTEAFDLVLLNSVVQYFPDTDYLTAVLSHAARVADRAILLGDVRNRALHRAMYVAAASAVDDGTPVGLVRSVAEQSMAVDSSLLMAPAELRRIVQSLGMTFTPLVRRGASQTEMTRFRYDAVLTFDDAPALQADRELRWTELAQPAEDLTEFADRSLVLRAVPDARTIDAVRLTDAVNTAPPDTTMGSLRRELGATPTIDPEQAWEQGHRAGYGVAIAPAEAPGHVDIALLRGRDDRSAARLLTDMSK